MGSTDRFAKLSHEVKYDTQGRRLCRFCPNVVPKGRRTWCSLRCIEEYLTQSDARFARRRVRDRDRGVCALCGVDTELIRAHMRFLKKHSYGVDPLSVMFTQTYNNLKTHLRTLYNKANSAGDFWQADHTTPVCEGGGCAALDQLRTLCTPCHKAETKKLAARRAEQRRLLNDKAGERRDQVGTTPTVVRGTADSDAELGPTDKPARPPSTDR